MADSEQVPEAQNGPSQSRMVLARPRLGFGSSSFSTDTAKSSSSMFGSSSVLRPAQLKPTLTANPFVRIADTDADSKESPTKEERLNDPLKDEEPPKFVPLGGSLKTSNPIPPPAQTASTSSSSGFIFGQNLSERVVVAEGVNNGGVTDHSSTNGNSELLFSSAVASNAENSKEEVSSESQNTGEGLAAAAAEYERSHARPPLAKPANTTTGEEEDTNVLQITCRLFAWEAGSWRERGRGLLRLNDCGERSRLVFRVLGSLRVVLNTKVWGEMVNERAGVKSLRITATDSQNQVKVFLIMASPTDVSYLHRELSKRISQVKGSTSGVADRCAQDPKQDYSAPPDNHLPDESEREPAQDTSHDEGIESEEQRANETEQKASQNGDDEPSENAANEEKESPNLKRKETDEEGGVSPKRQCPKIVIE